jgi:hypothetical protein
MCVCGVNSNLPISKYALHYFGAYKRHVMVITLYVYFATRGAAIAEPILVKEPTTIPRYERAKLCNGNSQGGEGFSQNRVNIYGMTRPVGGVGVKSNECGMDFGDELSGNGLKSILSLSFDSQSMIQSLAKPLNDNPTRQKSDHSKCPAFSFCAFKYPFQHDPFKTPLWWFLAFVFLHILPSWRLWRGIYSQIKDLYFSHSDTHNVLRVCGRKPHHPMVMPWLESLLPLRAVLTIIFIHSINGLCVATFNPHQSFKNFLSW